MNVFKALIVIMVALVVALAFVRGVNSQATDDLQTFFSRDYAGISIKVDATQETAPGENLNIKLWINCTAAGVKVEYLNLSIYGFRSGNEKILIDSVGLVQDSPMSFNYTSEYNFTVQVPVDVWDATYAELYLKYFIYSSVFEYNPSFSITIVRNIYYEQLQEDFRNLNESYYQLNQTFWELQQNYTALQKNLGELESTRQAAIALGVTTAFFVATTLYFVMRKPKQYW
jgi:hypothetical protein